MSSTNRITASKKIGDYQKNEIFRFIYIRLYANNLSELFIKKGVLKNSARLRPA